MAANRKAMTVPTIQFATTAEPAIVVSGAGEASENGWVLMHLFFSSDRRVMVRPDDRKLPEPVPDANALSDLGYLELEQAIDRLRKSNLENRQRQGIFLVADQLYLDAEIAGVCYTQGYVGRRDSCIVAFTERESLESFREYYPYVDVRVAQILTKSDKLDRERLDAISPEADLVVAPLASVLEPGGDISSGVKSRDLRLIVTGSDREERTGAAATLPSIVGVADLASDL